MSTCCGADERCREPPCYAYHQEADDVPDYGGCGLWRGGGAVHFEGGDVSFGGYERRRAERLRATMPEIIWGGRFGSWR